MNILDLKLYQWYDYIALQEIHLEPTPINILIYPFWIVLGESNKRYGGSYG